MSIRSMVGGAMGTSNTTGPNGVTYLIKVTLPGLIMAALTPRQVVPERAEATSHYRKP